MIDELWYKNAVIYSLDIETFMDASGDGVGDFAGLIQRLDYLESLGIDAIWLAPFQPSPNRDNGYDITDFYGVNSCFGSSGDFAAFIHDAANRGIAVIGDLVINHTSNEHPWFQEARRDAGSRRRSWYIWSARRPKGWNTGMVFPGVQDATWTRDDKAHAYYFHRFYDFQPDLNMANPDVRAEVRKIMGYWLGAGVSGFRIDALPFVLEVPPSPDQPKAQTRFDYLHEMRQFSQLRRGNSVLLAEANVPPAETRPYFGSGTDGVQMMFNFFVNQHLFLGLATGDARPLAAALRATRTIPPTSQWAHFLRNHDELDLGRLEPDQRKAVFARFGPDPAMQLYERGIRRRLASMLGDRRQLELAYSLLFSLPGAPVLRYGDEIGMGEDLALRERDAVRTPMQWSHERSAGFSLADPGSLIRPVVTGGVYGHEHVNVEAQRRDPGSLLNWMVRIIRQRKESPEIGWGAWSILRTSEPSVLAMAYDWRGSRLVILHNLGPHPLEVKVRVPGAEHEPLVNVIVEATCEPSSDGRHRIAMDGYAYHWYRVGGLSYALQRPTSEKVAVPGRAHAA